MERLLPQPGAPMTCMRVWGLCTYAHTLTCTYVHMLTCTHTYANLYTVHTLTCTYAHTLTCTYVHTLICTYAHTLTCTYAHTLTCTYVHMLTCTYAHMLTCTQVPRARHLGYFQLYWNKKVPVCPSEAPGVRTPVKREGRCLETSGLRAFAAESAAFLRGLPLQVTPGQFFR